MKQQAMTQRGQVVGAFGLGGEEQKARAAMARQQAIGNETAAQTQPQRPVAGALDALHNRINRLENYVDALALMLAPALGPEMPETAKELSEPQPVMSPMAAGIDSAWRRVDEQCRAICRLMDRIEL